jgi:hypothetical protein
VVQLADVRSELRRAQWAIRSMLGVGAQNVSSRQYLAEVLAGYVFAFFNRPACLANYLRLTPFTVDVYKTPCFISCHTAHHVPTNPMTHVPHWPAVQPHELQLGEYAGWRVVYGALPGRDEPRGDNGLGLQPRCPMVPVNLPVCGIRLILQDNCSCKILKIRDRQYCRGVFDLPVACCILSAARFVYLSAHARRSNTH